MKGVIRRFGGDISRWLLARPSNRTVGQANVPIALGICILLAVISIGFVLAQWMVTERLHMLQTAREAQLAKNLDFTQEMGTCQANAHRATLNILLARQADELAEARSKRLSNLHRYWQLLEVQETGNSVDLAAQKEEIADLFNRYSELSGHVVDLVDGGRLDEALAIRVEKLRPIFDAWQASQDQFAVSVNLEDSQEQADYLQAMSATRILLGALFILPAMLVLLGVVAIVALIGFQHLGGKYADPKDTWAH